MFKNLAMGFPILQLYLSLICEPLSQVTQSRECHQSKFCVPSVYSTEDLQAHTCHIELILDLTTKRRRVKDTRLKITQFLKFFTSNTLQSVKFKSFLVIRLFILIFSDYMSFRPYTVCRTSNAQRKVGTQIQLYPYICLRGFH